MDGGHDVDAGQNRRHAEDENREDREGNVNGCFKAEGHVKSPAGIDRAAAEKNRDQREKRAGNVKIPGEKVELGEYHVAAADEYGKKKVAENGGYGRDHHEEYLNDPVEREHRVVPLRRHDRMPWNHVDSHQHADKNRDEEKGDDGTQIENADAFVVRGEEPAENARIFSFVGEVGSVFPVNDRMLRHHRFPFDLRFLPERTK